MSAAGPRASVVVRTFNSAKTLTRCLESLRAQIVVPEIIVVDSGSTDGTLAIADRLTDRILSMSREAFSYGGALNCGAAAAAAPIHFALSSHCVLPRRDWIERALRHHERPDIAATNGQVTRPDGSPLLRELVLSKDTPRPDPLWGFSNHASSWRADLWEREPFDETLIASEDFEWSDRVLALGFGIVFDPALTVPAEHLKAQGAVALYRRSRRELLGTAACRSVGAPTLRASMSDWWSNHSPGRRRHRQLLSPYRLAVIGGRYTAGRTMRRQARRGEPIGRTAARVRPPREHVSPAARPRASVPVTVVIPAYNRVASIERAVSSALRQEPAGPAEVLVVDDCSTDDTADIACRAGGRVVRHDANRGAGAARNTAIAHSTQPWIAFLDSDDEWLPNHLHSVWTRRDGHALIAGAALHCEPEGSTRFSGSVERGGRVVRSPAEIATQSLITTSGVLVRRDVAQAAGGFRPSLVGAEDIDLWLRVLERGTGYLSPVVSLLYHVHPEQVSADGLGLQANRRDVLSAFADRPWFTPRLLRDWETSMAWDVARAAERNGDLAVAARLVAGIAIDPPRIRALLGVLVFRWRGRRRSLKVGRSGAPTIAVVREPLGADGQAVAAAFRGYEVVSPQGPTRTARYLALARRPTTALLVDGRTDRGVARLLGMRAVVLVDRGRRSAAT